MLTCYCCVVFVFFKPKTAYELRISDWSSDVCSSDLDVPVGSLRAMAEQGELTADKLLRALTDTKFTASIDAEFKQMPVTFDQAMTQVHNAAIVTFGAFDQGGEFSTILAHFVSGGADGRSVEHTSELQVLM